MRTCKPYLIVAKISSEYRLIVGKGDGTSQGFSFSSADYAQPLIDILESVSGKVFIEQTSHRTGGE